VIAGQPGRGSNGDEELRTIGVRAAVCHRKLARLIELVRRTLGLIFELIARAAKAAAHGIAALDHEIGNHAMENGAVIEWIAGLLAGARMRPFTFTLGEVDEVLHGFRSLFFKETHHNVALGRFKGGIESGSLGHANSFPAGRVR
jgi:hypothetical protein